MMRRLTVRRELSKLDKRYCCYSVTKLHARLPCPSLSPRVCSDSYPLSWWCHPSIHCIFCHPFSPPPSIFPSIMVFSNESTLHIRWPKYLSFSISPSNEYSGLIFFKIDWFDLLALQMDSQESSSAPQFESINSFALSLLQSNSHICIRLLEKP